MAWSSMERNPRVAGGEDSSDSGGEQTTMFGRSSIGARPEDWRKEGFGLQLGRASTGGASKEEGLSATSCDGEATERRRVASCTHFAGHRLQVFTGRGSARVLR
jgi:hypothetical protein